MYVSCSCLRNIPKVMMPTGSYRCSNNDYKRQKLRMEYFTNLFSFDRFILTRRPWYHNLEKSFRLISFWIQYFCKTWHFCLWIFQPRAHEPWKVYDCLIIHGETKLFLHRSFSQVRVRIPAGAYIFSFFFSFFLLYFFHFSIEYIT